MEILGAVILIIGFVLGMNWIDTEIWCYFAPMFHLPVLSFWQMFWFSLLIHSLFGHIHIKSEK